MAADNKHMKYMQNYNIFVPCEWKQLQQTITWVTNGHVAAARYMWNYEILKSPKAFKKWLTQQLSI